MAQDPGTFDLWITDRLTFATATPKADGTGDYERWITDRLYWQDYVEVEAAGETLSIAVTPDDSSYYKAAPVIIGA